MVCRKVEARGRTLKLSGHAVKTKASHSNLGFIRVGRFMVLMQSFQLSAILYLDFSRSPQVLALDPYGAQEHTLPGMPNTMCTVTIGIPCLGDPQHKGVLPFRQNPYRYNSCVDSLSNPEIFIVQHPSAAYPAYLITFT